MFIKGDLVQKSGVSKRAQLSVVVDRAQAGASLESGEMEFMVHRRLLADDNRGVGEALNETTGGISPFPEWKRSGQGITVSGKHKLLLSSEASGMKELREVIDEMYLPLTVVHEVSTATEIPSLSLGLGLGYDLPVNVHLLTFMPKEDNTILLRLAHQFAIDEDAELSAPVQVDLLRLLKPYHVKAGSLQEWTLSHNQLKKTQMDNKIIWSESTKTLSTDSSSDKDSMIVTLNPMQIKTFTVKCDAK
jgi:alpha-mannosidase